MKTLPYLTGIVIALELLLLPSKAADSFWKGPNGGTFSQQSNWLGGVPGPADNARFTNGTSYQVNWTADAINARAFFDAFSGVVTQAIGTFGWTVTNEYVIGLQPGSSSTVVHASGTLSVTNPAKTAQMVLGQDGFGEFRLEGGIVIADRILATNRLSPLIVFADGNLVTRNDAYLDIPYRENRFNAELWLGNTPGKTFRWDVLGGNTFIDNSANSPFVVTTLGHAPGSRGVLSIDGSNSVWRGFYLSMGGEASICQLLITNGGKARIPIIDIADEPNPLGLAENHSIIISGAGSRLQLTDPCCTSQIFLGGTSNLIVLERGAAVEVDGVVVSGKSGTVRVAGTNSIWTNVGFIGDPFSGFDLGGQSNRLIIADSGQLIAARLYISAFTSLGVNADNTVSVNSGGSLIVTNDFFVSSDVGIRVGSSEGKGTLAVDGGTVTAVKIELFEGMNSVFDFRSGVVTTEGFFTTLDHQVTVGDGTGNATLNLTAFEFFGNLVVSSNATVNLRGTNLLAAGLLTVTNGPTSRVNFESGNLTAFALTVSNGLPFAIGNGTDSAKLFLLEGNHVFADGLVVSSNSLLITSGEFSIGHVVGDLTLNSGAVWQFDLESTACPESNQVTRVTGNVVLSGIIDPLRVSKFVPMSYPLFTHTGNVSTNGLSFRNVPAGFAYSLDLSQSGIASLRVTFAGPAPLDSIVNPVHCGNRVSLSFVTSAGQTYNIDYKDDLNDADWNLLEMIAGTGQAASVIDSNANISHRFYRLRIQ